MRIFVEGVAEEVVDFCGGGSRILWRGSNNFLRGTVHEKGFFSDLFSG